MNNMHDKHAPFKKITKYKLKFRTKPWITLHYRNLFLLKIKFLKNCTKRKDITQKNEHHNNYQIYGNLISTLMKRSKQDYYSILKAT